MQFRRSFVIHSVLIILLFLHSPIAEAAESNIVQGIVKASAPEAKDQKPLREVEVIIRCIRCTWEGRTTTESNEENKGRYILEVPIEHKYENLTATYKKDGYIDVIRDKFKSDLAIKELDSIAMDKEREDGKYNAVELSKMAEYLQTLFNIGVLNEITEQSYLQIVTEMNKANPDEKIEAFEMSPTVFLFLRDMEVKNELCFATKYGKCLYPEGFVR